MEETIKYGNEPKDLEQEMFKAILGRSATTASYACANLAHNHYSAIIAENAIGFAEWISDNVWERTNTDLWHQFDNPTNRISSAELYQLYLTNTNK